MNKKIVFLPYDFDTALGINNEGELKFGYHLEDTDQTEGNEDVYNGQHSVLWSNLRETYGEELQALYASLRSSGAWSYAKIEKMFEDHQAKWPEAVFNEDAWFKYLAPLKEEGSSAYLAMLQGSKAEQRKWWLYNRMKYIDSKYNAGDSLTDVITLRGYAKSDISLVPYADIYATIKYGSVLVSQRATRGQRYTLACPLDNLNDTEIYIYSASQLSDIGDLSGLKVGYAEFSYATKLSNLKLGDDTPGYTNGSLTFLGLGNNRLLRKLDLRNCVSFGTGNQKSLSLVGCTGIEEAYFDGTQLSGVTFPNGGVLKKLHLPGTITNLTLRNQAELTEFVCPDFTHITTLWLENAPQVVDTLAIVQDMQTGGRARLFNFRWSMDDLDDVSEMFDKLDTMRGLDQNGNNTEKAQVYGAIHVTSARGAQLSSIAARYSDVTITYDTVVSYTYSYDYNGETLLHTEERHEAAAPTWNTVPERESDMQYHYHPVGWSMSKDAQTADDAATAGTALDVIRYAAYSRELRSHVIRFVRDTANGGGTLQTLTVPYGTVPAYTGSTPTSTQEGFQFDNAWDPPLAAVTGPTTYTAVFRDMRCQVTYMVGETQFATEGVMSGNNAHGPSTTPTKTSTAQYNYTFLGWSAEDDNTVDSSVLNNITANKTVYACFRADVRSYTITFVKAAEDGGGTLQTRSIAYGTMASYTGSTPTTTREGEWAFADSWQPALAVVTGPATYTAVFADMSSPVVKYLKRTMVDYFSDTATTVALYAFYNMTTLKTATTSATTIASYAFSACSNLETVDLTAASGVVSIDSNAFNGCSKLEAIFIRSSSVATLSSTNAFPSGIFSAGEACIYVPADLVSSYKAATNWSTYAKRIFPIDAYPVTDFSTISESWTAIKAAVEDESFFSGSYVKGDIKQFTYGTHTVYGEIRKIDATNKFVDFVIKNFDETCKMNTSSTMLKYADSKAKQRLDTIYADELPSDLKSAITPVTKKYHAYDGTTEEVTAPLWLLNTKDAGLTGSYLKDQEGEEYFSSNAERIKYNQQTGSADYWWLGSAYSSSYFMLVNSGGSGGNGSPGGASGLVFGFRIQKSS